MYSVAAHSFQTILEAEIEASQMENYLKLRNENPVKPIIALTQSPMVLEELVNANSFSGLIYFADENGDPDGEQIGSTTVNIKKKLLFRQLDKNSPDYPEYLEYYLFGSNSDWHFSHYLSKAPNFEQELDVSLSSKFSNNKESEIIKISIPLEKEKSRQLISNDPLTQNDYTVETENAEKFEISIINRFWINNGMLN